MDNRTIPTFQFNYGHTSGYSYKEVDIRHNHDVLCAMNIMKERFKRYVSFECPECDCKYSYNLLVLGSYR